MVYINSDGSIGSRPWYKQLTFFFWGIIDFVYAFFRTLVNPGSNNRVTGNWSGPSGGPPRPPHRRMSRFATISSCQVPMPGGG